MKPIRSLPVLGLLVVLSGCYAFEQPPYAEADLKPLKSTEFGAAVLKYASEIPDTEYTTDLKKTIRGDTMVREVSTDFLITQSNEQGSWQLSVMMRNSHHISFCSLFENPNLRPPKGVRLRKQQGALAGGYTVSGEPEALRDFADLLTFSGPKLCISIPYDDPRNSTPIAGGGGGGIIGTVTGLVGKATGFVNGLVSQVLGLIF